MVTIKQLIFLQLFFCCCHSIWNCNTKKPKDTEKPKDDGMDDPEDSKPDNTPKVDITNATAELRSLKLYPFHNRTCPKEIDVCDGKKTLTHRQSNQFVEQLGQAVDRLGKLTDQVNAVNGVITSAITNKQRLIKLITSGLNFARELGLGPKERIILVDNRCDWCELWVKCSSLQNDGNWVPLDENMDYIMKFISWVPGWEHGWDNGEALWNCKFVDDATGKQIIMNAYGGSAPRDKVGLYEIRARGVYRLDVETGRIDLRQRAIKW